MPPNPETPLDLVYLCGDGIGVEVVPAACAAVDAAIDRVGFQPVAWTELPMGLASIERDGTALSDETITRLATADGWILGPHDSAAYPDGHRQVLNPSGTIRRHFDLFANIRPAKAVPGAAALAPTMDLVVVRENTQGFYADRNTWQGTGEFMPTPDTAISMGIFTRPAVERILHVAFGLAQTRRQRLTIAHKANVLRLTTGMFVEICDEVAPLYPDVEVEDFHIDALAAHLIRRPDHFDVIVTENMFGDILSDLTGELSGSLGMAPSINHSAERAMAQATHGAAPDIAGRNSANPAAMILSSAMLLAWLGQTHGIAELGDAAALIDHAVTTTIQAGTATVDLGGSASCDEFAAAVVAGLTS